MLVDRKHFKYITIDPGIYEVDHLCFPPILLEKLLPLPAGDWNHGRISQGAVVGGNPAPVFTETIRKALPSINPLWHAKSFDYLTLKLGERLRSNVYTATSPQFEKPIIAKFARFPWEIGYYTAETQASSWIDGHHIGPDFLGYLTEEGRVIGFLLEYIEGHRHASISDLPACKVIVRRLHAMGILHRDLNKHNFLISDRHPRGGRGGGGAVLINFETAEWSGNREAMEKELEGQLSDESGKGGVVVKNVTTLLYIC